ncbi:hypothetical protein SAMN02910292_02872 [Lachnospiraceae bacterium XBB2008]|nr:hypothetical protein SAMN02910292_02872 [Lachnospiraceae bacterium XBB2008]
MDEKELFELIIFSDDLVEPPILICKENYAMYLKALMLCSELSNAGVLEYNADDPNKPLALHQIIIEWKTQKLETYEFQSQLYYELLSLISIFSNMIIDADGNDYLWTFSMGLYRSGKGEG